MKKLLGMYKGKIVSVEDPEGINRAKVRVKGLMDGIPESYLPWARYMAPTYSGGSSCPPVVGKKVWIRFADGDINYPYYQGGVVETEDDLPDNEADERYVIFESADVVLAVNTSSGDIEIKTANYNTTLGTIIDLFLQHTHVSAAPGSPTSPTAASVPPIAATSFNTGSLV